jgi:hypothetical protein
MVRSSTSMVPISLMEEDISYMAHMTTSTHLAVKVFCRTTMAAMYCTTITVCINVFSNVRVLMDGIVPTYISYLDINKRLGWDYIEYVDGWPILVY